MIETLVSRAIMSVKVIDVVVVDYVRWNRGVVFVTYVVVPWHKVVGG